MAVVYIACSKSTQERLLAAKFGTESAVETYNFISLVKTLGAMYGLRTMRWSPNRSWGEG